jgi:transcriptional regulator with XRE-family HTH domain
MPSGADTLKDWRRRAGWSQEQLSVRAKISEGMVSHYETGKNTPRRAMAEKIDRLLGADGAILAGFGYGPANDAISRLDALEDRVQKNEGQLRAARAALRRMEHTVNHLSAALVVDVELPDVPAGG